VKHKEIYLQKASYNTNDIDRMGDDYM